MRQRYLLAMALASLVTQGATAAPVVVNSDMITIDVFTSAIPGGDGAVNNHPPATDATDRTAADDGSIMSTGTGFRDRELEATQDTLFGASRGGSATVNTGPGTLTGNVHVDTTLIVSWDGLTGDSFGLDANGAFDLLTQTGGNGQHSLFIDGSDGGGDNVTFDVTARSASATFTVSGLTFQDGAGSQTQILFSDFTGVDFSALHGIQILFKGTTTSGIGEAFTLNSVYAHNPEPASLMLMGGLAVCGLVIRRRRK